MTPERIEEIKRENEDLVKTLIRVPIPSLICASGQITELLAALEEAQQEAHKQNEEAKRLNEICNQLAGEEMLFQDGKYETEMQKLEGKLAEAQQTIARQREHIKGIHRIIVSSYRYSTQEQLRSVLTSAEWACAEALEDLKVGEGETQP